LRRQGATAVVPDELPRSKVTRDLLTEQSGWVGTVDSAVVGQVVVDLGGGRKHKEDRIDPSVGVVLHAGVGSQISVGQPLVTIHAADESSALEAEGRLRDAFRIDQRPPDTGRTVRRALIE
jgi:thymidine phosphorylase